MKVKELEILEGVIGWRIEHAASEPATASIDLVLRFGLLYRLRLWVGAVKGARVLQTELELTRGGEPIE